MIKTLEIVNFEAHLDSKFEFGPGLNLLLGKGDAGKSSVIRALKLVCFNEFNPKTVKVGHRNCEVTATTEKGSVKVIRGKDNDWKITYPDGTEREYHSIGQDILPEAAEVLGLKLVKVGGKDMNINIMDQLEGHFMLAEVDGKSSSGSSRAQIIDEISGLSGVEDLIKDVNLDRGRYMKDAKASSEQIDSIKGRLEDVAALNKEKDRLQQIKGIIDTVDAQITRKDQAKVLQGECQEVLEEKGRLESVVLPDIETMDLLCTVTQSNLQKYEKMVGLSGEYDKVVRELDSKVTELSNLPDVEIIASAAQGTGLDVYALERLLAVAEEYDQVERTLQDKVNGLANLPDVEHVDMSNVVNELNEAIELSESYQKEVVANGKIEGELGNVVDMLKIKLLEEVECLSQVSVCPLDGQVLSEHCYDRIKERGKCDGCC